MPRSAIARLLLGMCLLFQHAVPMSGASPLSADSIMQSVFTYVERNNLSLYSFQSDSYLRFLISTARRNALCKYIPGLFALEKGERDYIGESHILTGYRYPGTLRPHIVALHSTLPQLTNLNTRVTDNFNMSLYSTTLLTGRLLSPVNARNQKFYRYRHTYDYLSSVGDTLHHIEVRPRFHNTQLVRGYIDVSKNTGGVSRFDFTAYYDLLHLHMAGKLGEEGAASLVPTRLNLTTRMKLFGNKINSRFNARIKYDALEELPDTAIGTTIRGYDLTETHLLIADTAKMRTDKAYFDSIRPYPLDDNELFLYNDTILPPRGARAARSSHHVTSIQAQDILFDSHYIDILDKGSIKLPPIITPSMFQWSHSRGFYIQTRLLSHLSLRDDRQLSSDARVRYSFKQNMFYWRVPITFRFAPRTNGRLHVEVGNGNVIYDSEQADEVRSALEGINNYDSLINVFNSFDFQYYKDFYAQAGLYFDPVVGLNITVGLRYHNRTLQNWNAEAESYGMQHHIRSVAPHVRAVWTPGTYYYREGKKRIPLYSNWPTFTLDYERGIKWGNCQTEYERWETDISYQLKLYALRALYFRLGGGLYTNQSSIYFVDFDNFRDNNMPDGWDDEMSGQFQLLDSRWYNESRYYLRFCMAYESPMLFLSRIKYLSNYIQKEHIYCNLLSVHALQPYAELGYGLSTHLFKAAAFVSAANGTGIGVGAKFSLCLFSNW